MKSEDRGQKNENGGRPRLSRKTARPSSVLPLLLYELVIDYVLRLVVYYYAYIRALTI